MLGGRGHFGGLVARSLAREARFEVLVPERATLEIGTADFARNLAALRPQAVVHAAGPFIPGDHSVARACIEAGAHCVDLADSRGFVCEAGELDALARSAGVLVVSGASSVPGLSSAVVDRYARDFAHLAAIDMGIASSSRLPGVGTVRSVLGYAGRPIAGGRRGWTGLRRHRFRHGPLTCWLCDCDVPDLELFARRYPGLRSVRFSAGTEVALLQWGLRAFAGLAAMGLVRDPAGWAPLMHRAGRAFERFGQGRSAMFVTLHGFDRQGVALARHWELHADGHRGVEVPTLAAVALVRKLADGSLAERGSMPCLGLLSLDEWQAGMDPACMRMAVD